MSIKVGLNRALLSTALSEGDSLIHAAGVKLTHNAAPSQRRSQKRREKCGVGSGGVGRGGGGGVISYSLIGERVDLELEAFCVRV